MDKFIQIDVLEDWRNTIRIVINTHEGSVNAFISGNQYRKLLRNGFFKSRENSGCISSTDEYVIIDQQQPISVNHNQQP